MSSDPKRILVLTGIRSEYDILYSVLRAIEEEARLEPSPERGVERAVLLRQVAADDLPRPGLDLVAHAEARLHGALAGVERGLRRRRLHHRHLRPPPAR